jgi:uncharacterized surface protein with fasciclin (FAS1) repeats
MRYLPILLFVFPVLCTCDRGSEKLFFEEDLVEIADYIINNKESYSKFHEIMIRGDLKDPLSAYNPFGNGFTLFLPTDEAFDRFIQQSQKYNSFDDLLADVDFIRELGRYHLVHIELRTNDFPYGALPDTTASGDFLTIGFSSSLDTTIYKVNNSAPIIEANLEMLNGYVHVISEVLEPVTFTGYEWIRDNDEYSILAGVLELTGLESKLQNKYTILAEHDSIYNRKGINSLDDLILKYSTPGTEYTDLNNGLYQFAAYHILEGSYFLADFETSGNYNTYGNFPISVQTGIEVRINTGVDTFAFIYSETDTSAITYISLYYQESNVLTKTGAIHFLTEVMEVYTNIRRSIMYYQFMEEPVIVQDSRQIGNYEYEDQDEFEAISWTGPDFIYYVKSSASEQAWLDDYLWLTGNFSIEYTMSRILPGRYKLQLRTNAYSSNNASIQVSLDGKRIGGNFDLTRGGTGSNPYNVFDIGVVELVQYSEHTIRIESIIPGRMIWDAVIFEPE